MAKRARTVDHTLLEDRPTSTGRAALAASARAERATVAAAEIAARAAPAPAPDRTFETCRDATAVLELYASFAGDAAETSPARLAVALRALANRVDGARRLRRSAVLRQDPAFEGLLEDLERKLEAAPGGDGGAAAVTIVAGLADLGCVVGGGGRTFERVLELSAAAAAANVPRLGLVHLARAAGSLVKCGLDAGSACFAALARGVEVLLRPLAVGDTVVDAELLSRLVWAFSRVKADVASLMLSLAVLAARVQHLLTPGDLAALAVALAATRPPRGRLDDLFRLIARRVAPELGAVSDRDLAGLAWAFGTARAPAPGLYAAVAAEAVARIQSFEFHEPRDVVAMAEGFARGAAAARRFDGAGALFEALALAYGRRRGAYQLSEVAALAGAIFDCRQALEAGRSAGLVATFVATEAAPAAPPSAEGGGAAAAAAPSSEGGAAAAAAPPSSEGGAAAAAPPPASPDPEPAEPAAPVPEEPAEPAAPAPPVPEEPAEPAAPAPLVPEEPAEPAPPPAQD